MGNDQDPIRMVNRALNKVVPDAAVTKKMADQVLDAFEVCCREGGCVGKFCEELIALVHKRAVLEEKNTSCYADFLQVVGSMLSKKKLMMKKVFHSQVLGKCKAEFDAGCSDADAKRKNNGNMRFIAELSKRCLLPEGDDIVIEMLKQLLCVETQKEPSEASVDVARTYLLAAADLPVPSEIKERVETLKETHSVQRTRLLLCDLFTPRCNSANTSPTSEPISTPLTDYLTPNMSFTSTPLGTPTKSDPDRRTRTVHITGIDSSLDDDAIAHHLQQLAGSKLVLGRLCGAHTNRTIYGFFEFGSCQAAMRVVEYSGSTLGRHQIVCSIAKTPIKQEGQMQALQERGIVLTSDKNLRRVPMQQWQQVPISSWIEKMARGDEGGLKGGLGDKGAKAVCAMLAGSHGCAGWLEFAPDVLQKAEMQYRVDALGMLIEGIDLFLATHLVKPNPYKQNLISRLTWLLGACYVNRAINKVGLVTAVQRTRSQLRTEEAAVVFNNELAMSLEHQDVLSMLFS